MTITLRAAHAYPQRVVHIGPHLGEGERRGTTGNDEERRSEMSPPTPAMQLGSTCSTENTPQVTWTAMCLHF